MLRLREARLARSSIAKCAAHFKVPVQTWLRWEKNGTHWERVVAAADFLGVTLDQMAGRAPLPAREEH